MKYQDLTGKSFGRWTVLERDYSKKSTYYLCKCECGTVKSVSAPTLKNGISESCGCLRSELLSKTKKKWNCKRIELIYRNMLNRCNNKNVKAYKDYGGRGISVCKEWAKDPMSFQEWAYSNGYSNDLTLDRINTDGNYEPSNCRFVSFIKQQSNRRNNIFVIFNDEKITIAELARRTNISDRTLYSWYHKGNLEYMLPLRLESQLSREWGVAKK